MYCGKVVDPSREMSPPAELKSGTNPGDYQLGNHTAMLFNVKDDPKQMNNVIEDNLDVAKELHAKYVELLKEKGTPAELMKIHEEFTLKP